MVDFAGRFIPALVAILFLGSSLIPCSPIGSSADPVAAGVVSRVVEVAVEESPEVHLHGQGAAGKVDQMLAPCLCGCDRSTGASRLAKRGGPAVLCSLEFELPREEPVRPLALIVSALEGQRELPDPVPIPS
jgi:hypothetical protein